MQIIYPLDSGGYKLAWIESISEPVFDVVDLQMYLSGKEKDISTSYDINCDGVINVIDLIIMKRNYSKW